MNTIDQLYQKLVRSDFDIVVEEIYHSSSNIFGNIKFSRINRQQQWKVSESYEHIVTKHGWKIEDFNNVLHKKYHRE